MNSDLTLEEVMAFRERIEALCKYSAERSVYEKILYGYYRQYKSEAKDIAISDIKFLKGEIEHVLTSS